METLNAFFKSFPNSARLWFNDRRTINGNETKLTKLSAFKKLHSGLTIGEQLMETLRQVRSPV